MIKIHDIKTDEVIEREMNAAELKQLKKDQEDNAKREADILLQASIKAALLEKLGITEDEAKLLLG